MTGSLTTKILSGKMFEQNLAKPQNIYPSHVHKHLLLLLQLILW